MSEDMKVSNETTEESNEVKNETSQTIDETVESETEIAESVEENKHDDEGSGETDFEEKISELEGKLSEQENRYLRLYADFENFRRRTKKEQEAGVKYRAQSLITSLLPAIDNFERAMQIEVDNEQAKSVLDGVEMVYRAIIDALKEEGASQIEAVGKEFDPNLHQAVMQSEDDQYGSNIVVEEYQKGYILNDRVIRPSMVRVNK